MKSQDLEMVVKESDVLSSLSSIKGKTFLNEIMKTQEILAKRSSIIQNQVQQLITGTNFFMANYLLFDSYFDLKNVKFNNSAHKTSFVSSLAGEATTQYLLQSLDKSKFNPSLTAELPLNYTGVQSLFGSVSKESISSIKKLNNSTIPSMSVASYFNSIKAESQLHAFEQNPLSQNDFGMDNLSMIVNSPFFNFEIANGKLISPLVKEKVKLNQGSDKKNSNFKPSTPKINFSDVVGLEEQKLTAKVLLSPIIGDKSNWKTLTENKPIDLKYNLLFNGDPGTGKTYFAEALAGELDIPFYPLNGSDFIQGLMGEGKNMLIEAYETAAKNPLSMIFIDEADTIAASRGSKGSELKRDVLNTLLTLLDGVNSKNNIITISATNRLKDYDSALVSRCSDGFIQFEQQPIEVQVDVFKYHLNKFNLDDSTGDMLQSYIRNLDGSQMRQLSKFATFAARFAQYESSSNISPKHLDLAFKHIQQISQYLKK